MYNDQPQIKSVRRSTKGSGKPKAEPMTKRMAKPEAGLKRNMMRMGMAVVTM